METLKQAVRRLRVRRDAAVRRALRAAEAGLPFPRYDLVRLEDGTHGRDWIALPEQWDALLTELTPRAGGSKA